MTHFAIPIRIDAFVNNYPLFYKTPVNTKAGPKIDLKLKDPGGSLAGSFNLRSILGPALVFTGVL